MSNDVQPIMPSSSAAMQEVVRKTYTKKYPWHTISVGYSFSANPSEIKFKTLVAYASRMGKKLGKRFRVVDWLNATPPVIEVARLPDIVGSTEKIINPLIEALEKKV